MSSPEELQKMIKGFRVSDLQALLTYAGRNKGGKKYDLQTRALDLIGLHSQSIEMKIREIHNKRFQQTRIHTETQESLVNETARSNNFNGSGAHQSSISTGRATPSLPGVSLSGYLPKPVLNVPSYLLPSYPRNPDVKFKDLPFYDNLGEVMKPTSLVPTGERLQEETVSFFFTPQQLTELYNDIDVQVQVRFCVLETNCEQEDDLPCSVMVKVNNKIPTLPPPLPAAKVGMEPKRAKKPIDITSCCRRTSSEPNIVMVSWAPTTGRPYVIGIYLVRHLSSHSLVRRLKANGVRNPDHTTAIIKEKLCQDRDSEIATMSLRGSLMCPLAKIKMKLPCRALTCTHLQCFDAATYVQMNEKKPKWLCPVCDKPAPFKSLAIDGLLLDIVSKAPSECTEVQFHEDGSWTPVIPVKKEQVIEAIIEQSTEKDPVPKRPIDVISLDSDSDTEDSWPVIAVKKKICSRPPGLLSPVFIDSPESLPPAETGTSQTFDPFAPCSSKSDSNAGNSSALPEKLDVISDPLSLDPDVRCIPQSSSPVINISSSPTYSPASPPSQSFCSASTSAFRDPLELLNNGPSTSGQCNFTNFDLFSLIQHNQNESFQYPEEDPQPDIISID